MADPEMEILRIQDPASFNKWAGNLRRLLVDADKILAGTEAAQQAQQAGAGPEALAKIRIVLETCNIEDVQNLSDSMTDAARLLHEMAEALEEAVATGFTVMEATPLPPGPGRPQ